MHGIVVMYAKEYRIPQIPSRYIEGLRELGMISCSCTVYLD